MKTCFKNFPGSLVIRLFFFTSGKNQVKRKHKNESRRPAFEFRCFHRIQIKKRMFSFPLNNKFNNYIINFQLLNQFNFQRGVKNGGQIKEP
jgi:hypothetical protein